MIDSIRSWINGGWSEGREERGKRPDELQIALAVLLVEAACSDDHFEAAERDVIARLLERRFNLSHPDAYALLTAGEGAASEAAELFHFTRTINQRLSFAQRVELIEMLWEVAYSDGALNEYEDSLLRRVGGLIYVPDRERGMARQRVLMRLGLDHAT
jgi:uncharacterized tellurite resistance protein B-like protein